MARFSNGIVGILGVVNIYRAATLLSYHIQNTCEAASSSDRGGWYCEIGLAAELILVMDKQSECGAELPGDGDGEIASGAKNSLDYTTVLRHNLCY